MTTKQGSISPQEKEILRRRLEKLFQKENLAVKTAGKTSNKKSQKAQDSKVIMGRKQQPVSNNQLKQTATNPKNQKLPKSQKKIMTSPKEISQQNGYVKQATTKQNVSGKKITTKDKATKFQHKPAGPVKKSKENNQNKDLNTVKPTDAKANKKINNSRPTKSNNFKTTVEESLQEKKKAKQPTAINKNKNEQKCPKTCVKEEQNSATKPFKSSTNKMVNPVTNGKMSKNQMNKAKKRAAVEESFVNEANSSNKKPKLTINTAKNTNNKKCNKKSTKAKAQSSASSVSEDEQDFDVNNMTGFVRGGDFDVDSEEENDEEHNYWMQEENYIDEDGHSGYEYNDDDEMEETANDMNETGNELEQYEANNDESAGSEEEYFDSYDEYGNEFDDELEEEEEEESYSDFDENDYEEDEDSYNYSMVSEDDDDYSTNYDEYDNNMSYDFNEYDDDENDSEYKLPEHVPEDLIIHGGTATKRELNSNDNVAFDSDTEETQIVELSQQDTIKVIKQPKAYEKEELLKLKYEENTLKASTFQQKTEPSAAELNEATSDSGECPKLVPIVDEDGFQLYNSNEESEDEEQAYGEEELDDKEYSLGNESMDEYEQDSMDNVSLGSEYMEMNSDDADSFLSEDCNYKYLNRGKHDSDSEYSIDEEMWERKHKADVVDATHYKCENGQDNVTNLSDISLSDDAKQIPSLKLYEHVKLKTGSSILSATVIDNKIFNDKMEERQEEYEMLEGQSLEKEEAEVEENEESKLGEENENMQKEEQEEEEETMKEVTVDVAKLTGKHIKSTAQSLINYNTKFFNALDSNLIMVHLKDPFYIYGTVRLTLLAGSVEVYGHKLDLNKEVEIFSPRGCSVIEISPSKTKTKLATSHLKECLQTYEQHFALADLKSIVDMYNCETDAVVLLKRNEARKKVVQQFKKFMNENVFPNINNISVERPLYNSEYLLRCMINTSGQEQKCLRLPQQWQQLAVTSTSRIMLAGGKSVGKSTLLRYLINHQLPQAVLLIDLDIGQPEVFVPQTVSCSIVKQPLLGPGFMLNLQPEMAYAVGHTNIVLCAHKYMAAVRHLIAHCKQQPAYQNLPWLINTMGYNKGFGLELISILAQELPLTDLIQLQSCKEINNFDDILHGHVLANVSSIMFAEEDRLQETSPEKLNYRLHVWQSAVQQESRYQKEWGMSAKDMRFAILLTRLSQALQGHAEWLTDIKPLSASLDDIKILNLSDNMASTPAEVLAKSIEANLVYLCHYDEDSKPLKCLGIGVVRAIDFNIQRLYLIPALPYGKLKEVNCVAIGEMPLPTSLFTNQGSSVKNIAPFVYNTVAANASKAIKQIYHRPRKFLKGKHKSLQ